MAAKKVGGVRGRWVGEAGGGGSVPVGASAGWVEGGRVELVVGGRVEEGRVGEMGRGGWAPERGAEGWCVVV